MTKNFYDSLNEFVTDARFRGLAVTQNFEGFLGHYGINEAENMYTFGWLLQPKGSHGFQDLFLKEFLTAAWTNIHAQVSDTAKAYATTSYYAGFSAVQFQQTSFANAFVDREYATTMPGADFVISDVASKTLVVVNNHYNKVHTDKILNAFGAEKYKYFEHKLFVTFDQEAHETKDTKWLYLSNDWLINLCGNIIECPQYTNQKISGTMKDFYQFLTGTPYGTHAAYGDSAASLMGDFFDVINEFRNYKAEKVPGTALVDINPREYAAEYAGKISEKEYGVLSLYWSYRNTFNTFFNLCELEGVTRKLGTVVEKKSYGVDRTFIRNGLRFTPSFAKVKNDRSFMNTIFNVELTTDMDKNLGMKLVINKASWDKLTVQQRETMQKDFGFNGSILNDRYVVMNKSFKQDWKNKDLCQEVVMMFEKVDTYLNYIGVRAA